MAYYYLIAQLPNLVYEQKPLMSSQDFLDLAKSMVTNSDFALLNGLSLELRDKATGCKFIDDWQEWERDLMLNLAKQRAIKLKRDLPATEPVYHMDIGAVTTKAMDEHSPLEGEILLDKARWHAIEDLAGNDYFHRNSVFAYYLKLLLIERRMSFNVDKGFSEYKSLYASIVESEQESRGEDT